MLHVHHAYTPMKFTTPYTSIYIVKLGFTGVYCFLFLLSNIRRLWGEAVLTCTDDLYFDIKIRIIFFFSTEHCHSKAVKTLHIAWAYYSNDVNSVRYHVGHYWFLKQSLNILKLVGYCYYCCNCIENITMWFTMIKPREYRLCVSSSDHICNFRFMFVVSEATANLANLKTR